MIIDSSIVTIYTSLSNEPSPTINILLFACFVTIFAFTNYALIRYSKQTKFKGFELNRLLFWTIVVIVIALCAMFGLIIAAAIFT